MNAPRLFFSRSRNGDEQGPASLIGVTEAGRGVLALLFCLGIAAVLVAAYWIAS